MIVKEQTVQVSGGKEIIAIMVYESESSVDPVLVLDQGIVRASGLSISEYIANELKIKGLTDTLADTVHDAMKERYPGVIT